MSFLTNLFNFGKKETSDDSVKENSLGEQLEIQSDVQDKNIIDTASEFLGIKPEEYIYISIGSVSVKILSTTKMINNKCKLIWMQEIFLGPFQGKQKGESVDNIYTTLRSALEQIREKIDGQKNIFVSLPAEGVFFKNIEVPKIDNKDKLLEAEIRKAIPIPFEDVLFANNIIWEKDNKEMHFCVIMQREYIEKFEEIFKAYNVKPYFEIETFSLSRVISKDNKTRCIVSIGGLHTLMVFTQNGNVVNVNMLETGSTSINIDMKLKSEITFEQAEELKLNFKNLVQNKMDSAGVIEDFVLDFSKNISKDISHTVVSFEGEYDRNVSEIAICGGGSVVPNLKENILENFDGNIVVKRLNSQNIIIADANEMHEENIPRFAQCIGLILMQI